MKGFLNFYIYKKLKNLGWINPVFLVFFKELTNEL
jgi:hypothetical protein